MKGRNVLQIFLRLIRLLLSANGQQTLDIMLSSIFQFQAIKIAFAKSKLKLSLIHQNYGYFTFLLMKVLSRLLLWYMEIDNREIDFVK